MNPAARVFRCQCANFPEAICGAVMTQEDLLCDTCRSGCNTALGSESTRDIVIARRVGHLRTSGFEFTLRGGAGT